MINVYCIDIQFGWHKCTDLDEFQEAEVYKNIYIYTIQFIRSIVYQVPCEYLQ